MAATIKIRRDTAANWTSSNPILSLGEIGFETNTGKLKIGDGSTAWNSLSYQLVTGPTSAANLNFAQFDGTTGKLIKDHGLAFDADGNLTADSDSNIPSQKAVKSYVDGQIIGAGSGDVVGPGSATNSDFAQFDGVTGKLLKDGGLSLDTDGTLAADSDSRLSSQKAVKTYVDGQIIGAGSGDVVGPGGATDSDFAQFDSATGKLIKDGGLALDTDGTLAADSDSKIPSQKAVKTYVDAAGGIATIATTPQVLKGDDAGNAVASDFSDDGGGNGRFERTFNNYTNLAVQNLTDDTNAGCTLSLITGLSSVSLELGVDSPSFVGDSGIFVAPGTWIFATQQLAVAVTGPTIFSNDGGSTEIARFDQCLTLKPLASAPGSPTEGMIYADQNHHLYYYNGTTWKQLDN
jgi:hypothetical protein